MIARGGYRAIGTNPGLDPGRTRDRPGTVDVATIGIVVVSSGTHPGRVVGRPGTGGLIGAAVLPVGARVGKPGTRPVGVSPQSALVDQVPSTALPAPGHVVKRAPPDPLAPLGGAPDLEAAPFRRPVGHAADDAAIDVAEVHEQDRLAPRHWLGLPEVEEPVHLGALETHPSLPA